MMIPLSAQWGWFSQQVMGLVGEFDIPSPDEFEYSPVITGAAEILINAGRSYAAYRILDLDYRYAVLYQRTMLDSRDERN